MKLYFINQILKIIKIIIIIYKNKKKKKKMNYSDIFRFFYL